MQSVQLGLWLFGDNLPPTRQSSCNQSPTTKVQSLNNHRFLFPFIAKRLPTCLYSSVTEPLLLKLRVEERQWDKKTCVLQLSFLTWGGNASTFTNPSKIQSSNCFDPNKKEKQTLSVYVTCENECRKCSQKGSEVNFLDIIHKQNVHVDICDLLAAVCVTQPRGYCPPL